MTFIYANGDARTNFGYIRDKIRQTQSGRDLIDRVAASRHSCRVEFVNDNTVRGDGGASAAPINPANDKLPVRAILGLFAPPEICRSYADVDRFSIFELLDLWAGYRQENGGRNLLLEAAIVASGLTDAQVIAKVDWPQGNTPFNQRDLDDLRAAKPDCTSVPKTRLWREHLWRLIWLLRPYLQRGAGANTRIRIGESIGQYYASYLPDIIWHFGGWVQFADAHVIVVHELVHALRIMEGRRVVDRGWEEEAMTIGLVPLDIEEFSENRYRLDCGMPAAGAHNDPGYSSQTGNYARMGGGDPNNVFSGPQRPR